MNQINANAPTPDEIMELARENERLKQDIESMKSNMERFAIEQQIEALEDLSINPNNESEDRVCRIIDDRIEQLRNLIDSDKI